MSMCCTTRKRKAVLVFWLRQHSRCCNNVDKRIAAIYQPARAAGFRQRMGSLRGRGRRATGTDPKAGPPDDVGQCSALIDESTSRHQKQPRKRQKYRTIGQCRIGLCNCRLILLQELRAFWLIQRFEEGPQSAALDTLHPP